MKIAKRWKQKKIGAAELCGLGLLANEIVLQAIYDWQSLDNGHLETAEKNYAELRQFFNSEWCDSLLHLERAGFNGRDILKWLESGGEMNFD